MGRHPSLLSVDYIQDVPVSVHQGAAEATCSTVPVTKQPDVPTTLSTCFTLKPVCIAANVLLAFRSLCCDRPSTNVAAAVVEGAGREGSDIRQWAAQPRRSACSGFSVAHEPAPSGGASCVAAARQRSCGHGAEPQVGPPCPPGPGRCEVWPADTRRKKPGWNSN